MDLDKQISGDFRDQVTDNNSNNPNLEKTCSDDNVSGVNKINIIEEKYKNITHELDKVETKNTDNLKIVDTSLISDPDIKEFTEGKKLYNSPDIPPESREPIPPKRHHKHKSPKTPETPETPESPRNSPENFKEINTEDLRAKISLSLENQPNKKIGKMEKDTKDYDNGNQTPENEVEHVKSDVQFRPQKSEFQKGQNRMSFMTKTKGQLYYKKKAACNEDERAKWITMIENIMEKGKIMSDLHSIAEEKRSSTLPNRINESVRTSTDSETHTTASAPDNEELIRPKKVSSSKGFKLDSQQISSVKLKRVSSEVSEPRSPIKKVNAEDEEVFDPKEKFGVQLRRVHTEKSSSRTDREQSPEYIEFKEKYNSLSLSRKNKIPKLPLNENSVCSHLVVNISREGETDSINIKSNSPSKEIKTSDPVQLGKESKDHKEVNRRRSPSPNIPISKAVEAVIKNSSTEETQEYTPNSSKPKLSICHATSTVISYYESSELNIDGNANNTQDKSSEKPPDIVSSSTVEEKNEKETITTTSSITTATKPDIVKSSHVNEVELKGNSNEKGLETELAEKVEKISINDVEDNSEPKDTKIITIPDENISNS
ncbi:hypothetical protein Anas_06462 [Armadillidium nasatum]|uniref:Uncharacterized protein n=1 Tax=Armadillidium nasatum TaxID=96803 RepID=A0A5N5TN25_9CRUS|nr:hypothetical protein Anas_06462 [Armadillidium nasatum]